MANMELPDFLELHTFSVAARWMHLTRAAAELNVTQGAVSQRIKQLELRLGTALFVRKGRELELTPAGHAVRLKAEALLAQRQALFAGSNAAEAMATRVRVVINTTPSLAGGWLVRRLAGFRAQHPDIDLQVACSLTFTRFRDSHAEIAIRFGAGAWPQVRAVPLMKDWIFPVASPALDPARWPQAGNWSSCPLLEDIEEAWQHWLPPGSRDVPVPVLRVNDALVLMHACQQGAGIALLRHRVSKAAIEAGQLVRLPGPAVPCRYAHWLVTPQSDSLSLRASEARDRVSAWLQDEAAREGAPAAQVP